jgi:acid phosphatase
MALSTNWLNRAVGDACFRPALSTDCMLSKTRWLINSNTCSHGERTPVNARFKNAGLPAYWPYCEAAKNFKDVILSADKSWDTLHWRRRLETFGPGNTPTLSAGPKGGVDAICQPGELTDLGRQTTLTLGQRTRKLYVDQLGFLPQSLETDGTVYLRSTPIQRALESVQQAFVGLYPSTTRSPSFQPPDIVTRSFSDETLFPNEGGCKRFAQLAEAFAERAAKLWNDSSEMAYINKRLGKWMPRDSPVIKVDSHPRLSGIMDSMNATLAHGPATKLPHEFYDPKVVESIDRICVEEWFAGYQESNEYRTLGIGGLVGDLTQRMVEHATGDYSHESGNFKMSLAGCHDTTVAATLASLGAFDFNTSKWPNFTSSVAFELFKRKDAGATAGSAAAQGPAGTTWPSQKKTWFSSLFPTFSSTTQSSGPTTRLPLEEMPETHKSKLDGYFVRLRYNDQPLTLPYCKQPGKHLEGDTSFCTLKAFKEAADSFTPKDWKKQCGENLKEPAMKAVGFVERPPGVVE